MRAALLLLLLAALAGPVSALGAHAGDVGAYVAVGKLERDRDGHHEGTCLEVVKLVGNGDGTWRVLLTEPTSSDDFRCDGTSLGAKSWAAGNALRGSPETGFSGTGTLLGVTDTFEIGALGSATAFHVNETSIVVPGAWNELRGSLDFAPAN